MQERQRETLQGLDANGTIQLGKLLPEKLGVTLPMYVGYSNQTSTPQFDPLSPDVELNDLGVIADQISDQDDSTPSIRVNKAPEASMRYEASIFPTSSTQLEMVWNPQGPQRRNQGGDGKGEGMSLCNSAKKWVPTTHVVEVAAAGEEGTTAAAAFFSIVNPANFSANYSYNEQFRQDIYTDNFRNVEHRGALNYTWQPKPKKREPFSNIGFLRNPDYFKLIRDVNFYLLPKQISASNQMQRMYEVSTVRDNMEVLNPNAGFEPIIVPQVVKTWTWNRTYTVKYDLTQALKFDYQGNAQALILEDAGLIPSGRWMTQTRTMPIGKTSRRVCWQGGEVTNYNHQVNGTLQLPWTNFH